ncbi:MAG: helix-turn-helix domain-containing protein [Planctomycetaceae bacterium]|nr:helix-turn-helix domain-containing protein [Planctomycetaceae bacterium]
MRVRELHRQGWMQCDIAAALGATESAVSQWLASARRGGRQALASHIHRRGVPPKLNPEQLRLLPDFLWHGAEAYGFRGTSGPVTGSPGSSAKSSTSPPARARCLGCSSTWDGPRRSRSPAPSSGTRRRSRAGGWRRGPI